MIKYLVMILGLTLVIAGCSNINPPKPESSPLATINPVTSALPTPSHSTLPKPKPVHRSPVNTPKQPANTPKQSYHPIHNEPLADVRFYAPGIGKSVALTFDDGPGQSTQAIIDVLDKYNITATFFNLGIQESRYPSLVREENRFIIGNHSWDHPDFLKLNRESQAAEITETSNEQYSLTGTKPIAFRPPYGNYNTITRQVTGEYGMTVWLWSVDPEDWKYSGAYSRYGIDRIVNLTETEGIKLNHPVIILHNARIGNSNTVAALPRIIEFFQANGYKFVSI